MEIQPLVTVPADCCAAESETYRRQALDLVERVLKADITPSMALDFVPLPHLTQTGLLIHQPKPIASLAHA